MKSKEMIDERIEQLCSMIANKDSAISDTEEGLAIEYDIQQLEKENQWHLEEINILNWVLDDNKIR